MQKDYKSFYVPSGQSLWCIILNFINIKEKYCVWQFRREPRGWLSAPLVVFFNLLQFYQPYHFDPCHKIKKPGVVGSRLLQLKTYWNIVGLISIRISKHTLNIIIKYNAFSTFLTILLSFSHGKKIFLNTFIRHLSFLNPLKSSLILWESQKNYKRDCFMML